MKKILSTPSFIDLKRFLGDSPLLEKASQYLIEVVNQQDVVRAVEAFISKVSSSEGSLLNKKYHGALALLIKTMAKIQPEFMKEKTVPERFKKRMAPENIGVLIADISLRFEDGLFTGVDEILEQYNELVEDIRKQMIEKGQAHSINWHARDPFILAWCSQLIKRTMHPELLKIEVEGTTAQKQLINQLNKIQTQFVLFVICIDDIADSVQKRDLTAQFAERPQANEARVRMTEKELAQSIEDSMFTSFYKFYGGLWESAVAAIKDLIPESSFRIYQKEFEKVVKNVMTSMDVSVGLNASLGIYNGKSKEIEKALAVNMLMTMYKTIEKMILHSFDIEYEKDQILFFDELFQLGEIVGHSANNVATLEREIKNGDLSNTILIFAQERLESVLQELGDDGISFPKYVDSVLNLKEDLPDYVATFSQLIRELRKINASIFEALKIKILARDSQNTEKIIDEVSSLSSLKEIDAFMTKYEIEDEDIRGLLHKKNRYLELTMKIFEECNIIPDYYKHVMEDIGIMDELIHHKINAVDKKFLEQYLRGVDDLFAFYLLFKSKM